MSKLGGPGDQAGMTPTPAMGEFLDLLLDRKDLFTQAEYRDHCFSVWSEWLARKHPEQVKGVEAKLFCNFYVSGIDTLHAYALMVEAGMFDICYIDIIEDVLSKTDLTLKNSGCTVRVQLIGPNARTEREYKNLHRGRANGAVEIQLTRRPKTIGGKMWYRIRDFVPLWEFAAKPRSQWLDNCVLDQRIEDQ